MNDAALIAGRDDAMGAVETAAGPRFSDEAADFVINYLHGGRVASGEEITDACKEAGIVPHDDRAFGPVYMRLSRQKLIVKAGTVARKKGNLTSGGNLWRLS